MGNEENSHDKNTVKYNTHQPPLRNPCSSTKIMKIILKCVHIYIIIPAWRVAVLEVGP